MAEYIEREKLLRDINHYHLSDGKFQHWVEVQQEADVAPVRHGRRMNANSRPKTYCRKCAVCGGLAYFCGIGCSYKYCPNCGAKMDGDRKEGADNG